MASMPLKLPSGRQTAPMAQPPKMPMEPDADDQQGQLGEGTAEFQCANCGFRNVFKLKSGGGDEQQPQDENGAGEAAALAAGGANAETGGYA